MAPKKLFMGHLHAKQKSMLSHIEAWLSSDLTQLDFCKQHTISFGSFQYHYRRYRLNQIISSGNGEGSFVPISIASSDENKDIPLQSSLPSTLPTVEIVMSNGKRVNFYGSVDFKLVRALLD